MKKTILFFTSMLLCSISLSPFNFDENDAYRIFTDEQMEALQEARNGRDLNYNKEGREEYDAKFREIFPELFENEEYDNDDSN